MTRYYSALALLVVFLGLHITALGQASCSHYIYVTPSGSSSGSGNISTPVTLPRALTLASSTRNIILMQSGNYSYTNQTITVPTTADGLTIDGRYEIVGGEWRKNSSLTTTINITPTYNASVLGYVAFSLVSATNVYLKDITIKNNTTASGVTSDSRGRSVYGVHINNSGGFYFTRLGINTLSASSGNGGLAGANGANGYSGTKGHPGDDDDHNNCNDGGDSNDGNGGTGGGGTGYGAGCIYCDGCSGGHASSSTTTRNGGGGGGGGSGGRDDGSYSGKRGGYGGYGSNGNTARGNYGNGASNDDCGRSHGSSGGGGGNGSAASPNYGAGNRPTNYSYSTYFQPGTQSNAGGDGRGGGGGGGGGGGSAQQGSFCNDGSGNGGGGGGGGGQGGGGGTGGYGGGGNFGIYVSGTSGTLKDSQISIGSYGTGGSGGNGGSGGSRGNGASGGTTDTDEVGRGGTGGNGGNGSTGGRGRDGANGVASNAYNVTQNGSSVPNPYTITANVLGGCTNSEITITKSGGTWNLLGQGSFVPNLDNGSPSYTTSSSTAAVYYTTTGHKDIQVSSVYDKFLLISKPRAAPTITSIPNTCIGSAAPLVSPTSGASYEWVIYQTTTASPLATLSGSSTSWVAPATGTYKVRLRIKDNCCGWSVPIYSSFTIIGPQASTTWTGVVSTDWFTNENWTNCVPGPNTDVTIPNTTNKPLIASGTGYCNTIDIATDAGARLEITNGILEVTQ